MKQRPFSASESVPSPLADAAASRRLGRLAAWAAAAALLAFTSGCPQPADLEGAESYCRPGTSIVDAKGQVTGCSDAASGGSSATPMSCETACVTELFLSCSGCHTTKDPLGGLDLQSTGVTARLKDQASKHQSAVASQCPSGDKLIDSQNPAESWLLKKVSGQQGGCGTIMPPGTMVTQDELTCLTAYVSCVGGGA